MTDPADTTGSEGASEPRIERIATELRACLTPLIHELAGEPPRPMRLTQEPGLDKSLTSRLLAIHLVADPEDIVALTLVEGRGDFEVFLEAFAEAESIK